MESLDLRGYDLVLSSSSAFGKGVITKPETLHICYCHTPMRWCWNYDEYGPEVINYYGYDEMNRLVYMFDQSGTTTYTYTSGGQLLLKSLTVWTTNVVAFGLWYWAFDRGGPMRRLGEDPLPPDFQGFLSSLGKTHEQV